MLSGCREYRRLLMEAARGAAAMEDRRVLLAHLEVCGDCARQFDQQLALSSALDSLKGEPLPDGDAIETRVMAEFDAVARRRSRWPLVAGIAAAIALGVIMMGRRQAVMPSRLPVVAEAPARPPVALPGPEEVLKPVRSRVVSHRPATTGRQPFLPIPFTIPLAPEERTTIVRMEIPVAALIAVGFNVPVSDPGMTIEADVVVGQDGRARAIRPVR